MPNTSVFRERDHRRSFHRDGRLRGDETARPDRRAGALRKGHPACGAATELFADAGARPVRLGPGGETVEVQLRNLASEPATVHRDKFRLLTPDGYALSTRTWGSADPLQVAAGTSGTFELRFQTHGSLECGKEMRLDPDAGITLREGPVALQPLSFVPQRAL